MSILSGVLGVETDHLVAKMVNYSPLSVESRNGIIKATFLHYRYTFSNRSDLINVDKVSMAWIIEPEGTKAIALGTLRDRISTQHHFKTDAGFEKAVTALIADYLNARLTEPNGTISNSGLGYSDPQAIAAAPISKEAVKKPSFSDADEKKPSFKSTAKKKPRRHGRGKH